MSLFLACSLTMLIETVYFLLVGYRARAFMILCLAVNMATNLSLNLALLCLPDSALLLLLLELLVAGVEYAVYALAFGRSKKLLRHTALANLLSYSIGCALWLLPIWR